MLGKKRGASLIISWVLLLGLAIGLGMAIFSWSKIQTEKQLESTINYVEGSMDCEQVSIGATVVTCVSSQISWINVTNTGKLKIEAVVLRNLDVNQEATYTVKPPSYGFPLMPFSQSENIGVTTLVGEGTGDIGILEIMPLVKKGSTYFACSEKKLVIQCE